MTRPRIILGLVAGALLVVSAGAHSFFGWPRLAESLGDVAAPTDLVTGLAIGWHFGGVAMLTFGAIVIALFTRRLLGQSPRMWPARLIASVYLLFGAWAMWLSKLEPFYLVFIVPGLLLLAAAWESGREQARRAADGGRRDAGARH